MTEPARIKARFIGGPWHNRVMLVPRLDKLHVPDYAQNPTCGNPFGVQVMTTVSTYILTKFTWPFVGGTDKQQRERKDKDRVFEQYVLEGSGLELCERAPHFPKMPSCRFEQFVTQLASAVIRARSKSQ